MLQGVCVEGSVTRVSAMSQVSPCISCLLSKLGTVTVKTMSVATERQFKHLLCFHIVTLRLIVCGEITIVMIVVRVARDGANIASNGGA